MKVLLYVVEFNDRVSLGVYPEIPIPSIGETVWVNDKRDGKRGRNKGVIQIVIDKVVHDPARKEVLLWGNTTY